MAQPGDSIHRSSAASAPPVPVRQCTRDIATLLVIDKLRLNRGLQASSGTTAPCLSASAA
jgi:hypothetical protein